MKRFLSALLLAASCAEAPLPPPQAPSQAPVRPESSRSVPLEAQASDPDQLKMECRALIVKTIEEMDDPSLRCASNFRNDIDGLSHACRAVILESDFDVLRDKASGIKVICGTLANCSRLIDDTQAAITKASASCAEDDLKAMETVAGVMDKACEELNKEEFPLLDIGRNSASLAAILTRDNCKLDETIDRIDKGLPR